MLKKSAFIFLMVFLFSTSLGKACSVLYYIDKHSDKIYVANNEDFYFDNDAYIQIEPRSKDRFARLWYGWDERAQGGINETGLFYDVAITPHQGQIKGRYILKSNVGDEMLSQCKTVEDALRFIESMDLLLPDAHIMFGDAFGNAVVVEWIGFEKKIIPIKKNRLVMTNFLLAAPELGQRPYWRYNVIEKQLKKLQKQDNAVDFESIGQAIRPTVQKPKKDHTGKTLGTLYTSFINITDMEFVLFYKGDNRKRTKLDLCEEFQVTEVKKIELN